MSAPADLVLDDVELAQAIALYLREEKGIDWLPISVVLFDANRRNPDAEPAYCASIRFCTPRLAAGATG